MSRLITPELAATLPALDSNLENPNPLLRCRLVSDGPGLPGWEWYVVDYSAESNTAFGLVRGSAVEGGYFNLDELEELHAEGLMQMRLDTDWEPAGWKETRKTLTPVD